MQASQAKKKALERIRQISPCWFQAALHKPSGSKVAGIRRRREVFTMRKLALHVFYGKRVRSIGKFARILQARIESAVQRARFLGEISKDQYQQELIEQIKRWAQMFLWCKQIPFFSNDHHVIHLGWPASRSSRGSWFSLIVNLCATMHIFVRLQA